MRNYYRIGITNEGKLLADNPNTFHGIVIQGNFTALYKDWLATFLQKLKKPFFVDPRTEVFGLDLNNIKKDNDFRASFQKLIDHYDNTAKSKFFSNLLKHGKLSPDTFITRNPKKWNSKLINVLVDGTITLQKNILNLDITSNKQSIKKYLKILEELPDENKLTGPEFLVAPYFYFNNTSSPWFEINVKLIDTTKRKYKEKVYAVICFDKEILGDDKEIANIISNYNNADGFLVWINGFYENKVETTLLRNYVHLLQKLIRTQKPIINLYGSYFTLLLSKYIKIDGYSRGIALGEGREVENPATGGGTPNRYYISLVHDFAVEETAIKVLSRYPVSRCKCDICKPVFVEVIKKRPPNDIVLATNFIKNLRSQWFKAHFMHVHNQEIKNVADTSVDLKNGLRQDAETAKKYRLRELDVKTNHLERWLGSLP